MYNKDLHFHFVACHHTGVSGLALLLHARGYIVTGSTSHHTHASTLLCERGIPVIEEYHPSHIDDADIIVFAPGVPGTHPEVSAARKLNKPTISHARLLAELIASQYSIAVTGTHGAGMLTALLGHLLATNRQYPSVVTDTVMRNLNAPALYGTGQWLVTQTNSEVRAMKSLRPTIGVITGVQPDDESYLNFLKRIPFYGTAFLCADEKRTYDLVRVWHGNVITYGFDSHAQIRGHIVSEERDHTILNISDNGKLIGSITVPLNGSHNAQHALGALAVCQYIFDIPFKNLEARLPRFRGLARNFEHLGNFNNAAIIDDAADDAYSIDALLQRCRRRKPKRVHVVLQLAVNITQESLEQIVCIFEKHTSYLFALHLLAPDGSTEEFCADENLLETLRYKNVSFSLYRYQDASEVADALTPALGQSDVVLTLGSGSVASIGQKLLSTV